MQARAIDIMDGIHLIDEVKNLGITTRNEVDLYHDLWYTEAVALAAKLKLKKKCQGVLQNKNIEIIL